MTSSDEPLDVLTDTAPTSARLIAAAMDVIERHGENSVRVRDIAAAAGVTYSAVQFHFGGRAALVDAAYLELYRRDLFYLVPKFAERLAAATDANDFADAVRDLLQGYFRRERADVRRRRALVIGTAAARPALADALAAVHRESFSAIAALLDKPYRNGWLRNDLEPAAMVAVLLGITNGRSLVEIGDSGVDLDDWDAAAMSAVLSFLVQPPSGKTTSA